MGLQDLDLPGRVIRILEREEIANLEDLVELNQRELLGLSGIGPRAASLILAALEEKGRSLADDPYAAHLCARHGAASWDTNLADLFLCDDCARTWRKEAFDGADPAYLGDRVAGYCLNCNIKRDDVRLRQWYLCGTCERVARSIGRSVVAERFVTDEWMRLVQPDVLHLELVSTDVPTLRRRDQSSTREKKAQIDFVARDRRSGKDVFGFELKTGKSYISGRARVGAKMGQFQLDTSDCDDITTVIEREGIPVYLLHVQVIDRAHPPTLRYVALASWWTDVFRMREYFREVHGRTREARNAAYFNTAMFEDFETFASHLTSGGYEALDARLRKEGTPALYSLPV